MARDKLNIDKTEIVAADIHLKKPRTLNLPFDRMTGIYFDRVETKKFFFLKRQTEKITVAYSGQPLNQPLYFLKSEEGEALFESYKEGLRKFAWDNHIPLTDNLK